MRFRPRVARRKTVLWSRLAVLRMLRSEHPELSERELELEAEEMTRQLNALDDRLNYNDWMFRERHLLRGLQVDAPDDPSELPGASD